MSQHDWDVYFYRIARDVQEKSKDVPQVGAVVVHVDHQDDDQIIISTGFNGPARKVQDLPERLDDYEGNRCGQCGRSDIKEKLRWVCHAEANAICNAARVGVSCKGATIYVTKFPCVACANTIIQAGIRRVFTEDTRAWKSDPYDFGDGRVTKRLFSEAGVEFIHSAE